MNEDFLTMCKIDDYERCVALLDKKRGDVRADINYKDEDDNSAIHYAA